MGLSVDDLERNAVLVKLAAAFPNARVSDETYVVYLEHLTDVPPAELKIVAAQVVATATYFPTVREIRDMWHELRNPSRPWTEAWEEVTMQMRKIGYTGKPQFSDPITERVVRGMGWRNLCASENPGIDRAQFRDAYTAIAQGEERERKLLPHVREAVEGGRLLGVTVAGLIEQAKEKVQNGR